VAKYICCVDLEGKLVETKIIRDIGFGTGAEAYEL
jgi:hypothetical protein